jgi:hypothetical protein
MLHIYIYRELGCNTRIDVPRLWAERKGTTMTDQEKVTPASKTARLARSLETFDPGLEAGSVIRWKIDYDETPYDFAALWANGQWFTTSNSGAFGKLYEHAALMMALVKQKAYDVELATAFEKIK